MKSPFGVTGGIGVKSNQIVSGHVVLVLFFIFVFNFLIFCILIFVFNWFYIFMLFIGFWECGVYMSLRRY